MITFKIHPVPESWMGWRIEASNFRREKGCRNERGRLMVWEVMYVASICLQQATDQIHSGWLVLQKEAQLTKNTPYFTLYFLKHLHLVRHNIALGSAI